jgi:hypothetical protein
MNTASADRRARGHAVDAKRRSSSFGEVLTRTSRRCTPKDKAIPTPHAGLIPRIRGRTGFGHMDPYPVSTATLNGIIPHKLSTTTLGSTASPARLLVDFDVVRAREAEPPTFSSHHAPPTRVVTAHFPFGPRGSITSRYSCGRRWRRSCRVPPVTASCHRRLHAQSGSPLGASGE